MDRTTKPAAEPAIVLTDVHLHMENPAGTVNILRGIDLSIESGCAIAIVGPSGSGKTTLMMLLGGLEQPTRGDVRVAGRQLGDLDEDALALFRRHHVGIVFQDFHLIPTMTALENVAIPLEFSGRRDAFAVARDRLAAVGLDHRLTHYPSQLSGGEQQRVAVARAFAADPDVVLADEPTGNLDGATGAAVMDLMFGETRRRGATLVLVTHDAGLAQRCDRVIGLADGRVHSDERPVEGPAVRLETGRRIG